jgi:peptidoglycan/xylan/chitin deacetylase (PgdA/CDA1 family)
MRGLFPEANRHAVLPSDRDLIGYGRSGADARWPNGARVAVNLVINYEEGAEYSVASGDVVSEPPPELSYPSTGRDLATESIFDYGSRAGIWRLQRMLDEYQLPATFFGVARAFELNPEVGAYIQEAGHDVCCHGLRWERVDVLPEDEERSRIAEAVESIEKTCGSRPEGWYCRAPASANTRRLLVEEGGFLYDSDSFSDDVPYFVDVTAKQHLVVPYSFVTNDSKFAPGQSYSSPSSFLDDIRRAFDCLWLEGESAPKMLTVGLHPRIIGQPARASALREFIEHALNHRDVWFARRSDIARWWIDEYGSPQPPLL